MRAMSRAPCPFGIFPPCSFLLNLAKFALCLPCLGPQENGRERIRSTQGAYTFALPLERFLFQLVSSSSAGEQRAR